MVQFGFKNDIAMHDEPKLCQTQNTDLSIHQFRKACVADSIFKLHYLSLHVFLNIVTNISDTRSNMARDSFSNISPLVQNPYWPAREAISARSCNSSLIQNQDGGTQTIQFVIYGLGYWIY